MEEKSNLQFFKFLSTQQIRILIPETATFYHGEMELLLINDESCYIKRKKPKPISIIKYFSQLIEENHLKNKLLEVPCHKVCYTYKRNSKKLRDINFLKEIVSKNQKNLQFDMIQKYLPFSDEKLYTAKIFYHSNQFHTNFKIGNMNVTDQIVISRMIDMLTLIISCIERAETKRVLQLSIEFTKDNNGELYMISCSKCLLVEAKLTINEKFCSEADLEDFIRNTMKQNIIEKSRTQKKIVTRNQ